MTTTEPAAKIQVEPEPAMIMQNMQATRQRKQSTLAPNMVKKVASSTKIPYENIFAEDTYKF
jgi:hypothetical protein